MKVIQVRKTFSKTLSSPQLSVWEAEKTYILAIEGV